MFRKIIYNFILYTICFFVSLYIHKGTLFPDEGYDIYYTAFMISWAAAVFASRKYKIREGILLLNRLYTYTISFFLMLGILSLVIFNLNLIGVSRFVILNSLLLAFTIEIITLLYKNKYRFSLVNIYPKYSNKAFTFEVSLYGIINLFIFYKLKDYSLFNSYDLLLFISLYLSWFVGSFWGHGFHPALRKKDYLSFIWQYFKSYVIILALIAFSTFINRLEMNSIITILYGVIVYSVLSFIGISCYYYIKKHRTLVSNIDKFPVKYVSGDVLLNETIPDITNYYKSAFNLQEFKSFSELLKNFSLKRLPKLYEFLNDSIDLNSFDYFYSMILKSDNISNIDYLPERSLQIFINLQRINDVSSINDYLIEINKKLMSNGIFAGNLETSYLRHQIYLKKYPYYFAQLFYFIDFIWNSIFANIPVLNKFYLMITGENKKALSLAEGLGRLYYCGFEILHLKIIDNRMYFIARKIKEPASRVVSKGLIFKMKRLGKNGKPIYVYKLRTMYPYAEYLQEFIYEKFNLKDGGKFKNDFRITIWGNILRKLWLDELPMLYNWIKGDLKLVGFRPLSNHYFSLYREELKQKRLKCKPGLIPPFYADIPKTFNEIMESEERYLDSYSKNPLRTDVNYLIRCFNNILFKGARSS